MERPDIEYLNLPEKVKKKLYAFNINTLEKLSTNYLENVDVEEVNAGQNELFSYHVRELGVPNGEGEEGQEDCWKDPLHGYNHPVSDQENYCYGGSHADTDDGGDAIDDALRDSVESSSSSPSASVSTSTSMSMSTTGHGHALPTSPPGRRKYSVLKSINPWTHLRSNNSSFCASGKIKNNSIPVRVASWKSPEGLERDFLACSNYMKASLSEVTSVKTNSHRLNKLLGNGIQASKIYFFYGKKTKMNKVILLNLLCDFLAGSSPTAVAVFIHFSYINDVTVIEKILKKKVKREKKKKLSLDDILNRLFIFHVRNWSELISFLENVRKEKTPKKGDQKNPFTSQLANVACIGIDNFTNMFKELSVQNSNTYFYLVRELKILSVTFNIPILIFDYAKYQIEGTVGWGKRQCKEEEDAQEGKHAGNGYKFTGSKTKRNANGCPSYEKTSRLNLSEEEHATNVLTDEGENWTGRKNKRAKWKRSGLPFDSTDSSSGTDDSESYADYHQGEDNTSGSSGRLGSRQSADSGRSVYSGRSSLCESTETDEEHASPISIHIEETTQQEPNDDKKNAFPILHNSKYNSNKTSVPYYTYNLFDCVLEIEILQKTRGRKKMVQFTLLKSQNSITHLYVNCCIQSYTLMDVA
ncbi:Uncharacterized protein PCOAH_00020050 [Plasmodium coatneyi]|uniref:Uncharacterized protein n=1 Tax=Plasmodium coatneyi TaxID=208452 RepID=A0A1B1DZ29_9APIC|nr:Uncharacterized protein PCOAH_00020050 [Plasmodium coatneyi]ANQ07869.1 Uncharacterized protein PCOAH_00020050 [Plasmodium coatneyi]